MFFQDGSYKLSVNGSGGTSFSEARYIHFEGKGFTIYIQTDKAVYKPGQNGRLITTKYFARIFSVIKKGDKYLFLLAVTPSSLNPVECKESRGENKGNRGRSRRDVRELKRL